jgi:class 3 adenylate cyclase
MARHKKNPIPRFSVTGVIAGGFFIFFALSAFFSTFMSASDTIKQHIMNGGVKAIAVINHERGEESGQIVIEAELENQEPPFFKNRLGQGMPVALEAIGIILIICLSQAYHYPVKSFFRKKRRGQNIPAMLEAVARRRLSRSPLVLGLCLPLAMTVFEFIMVGILKEGFAEHAMAGAQLKLMASKTLLAAMAGLFMFLWQRHRVQTVFLKCAYSKQELSERMPPGRKGSIRGTLALLSVLTAVLPAAVIISLVLSGFSVIDSSRELSADEIAILDGRLNLDGDRYLATVMFTDIRNFTAMSESMSPEEVFRFLNGYLDAMIEVIMSKGGFIDKFIGDGILSVFGLPVRGEDHARLAVETALEMRDRLDSLNADRKAAGLDPIAIGSGIHTGPVIAGNVGNEKRVQFTVIGDTVNLASRLEGLNKRFASSIILSDATWSALPEDMRSRDEFVRLSDVEVRGKKDPLTLYKAG